MSLIISSDNEMPGWIARARIALQLLQIAAPGRNSCDFVCYCGGPLAQHWHWTEQHLLAHLPAQCLPAQHINESARTAAGSGSGDWCDAY